MLENWPEFFHYLYEMATVELELTDVTNSVTTGIILGAPCGSATCVSFSGMVARGPST